MALPKRGTPKGVGMNPNDVWTDPEFVADYPCIHAFLNDVKYADGSTRVPGGFTLYVKYGVLTLAVNDNDRMVVAYLTATTWTELLFKAEDGIATDVLDWKAKTPYQPKTNGDSSKVPPF